VRKLRTKSLPDGHVQLPIPVYRRLQALVIESNRSEEDLLTMAIRLLCTAVSRTANFNIPGRTSTPQPKSKRSPVTPIGATVQRAVNKIRKDPDS